MGGNRPPHHAGAVRSNVHLGIEDYAKLREERAGRSWRLGVRLVRPTSCGSAVTRGRDVGRRWSRKVLRGRAGRPSVVTSSAIVRWWARAIGVLAIVVFAAISGALFLPPDRQHHRRTRLWTSALTLAGSLERPPALRARRQTAASSRMRASGTATPALRMRAAWGLATATPRAVRSARSTTRSRTSTPPRSPR